MSELPTRIEVGAESGSIILSGLIRIDSVLSSFSFSLLHSSTILLQKCNSAYMGQRYPNSLDGKKQEVKCHQQKIDWRLSDVHSSLKVVLCTK